jgi:protein phosphatase
MRYYGITDRGKVRKDNQDSYVIATNAADEVFAIVADGIGGNSGGDIASRMAVGLFSKLFSETEAFQSFAEAKRWINHAVYQCNHAIYSYGRAHEQLKGMGTTLCGVLIAGFGTVVVNIGDSRVYCWQGRDFHQLTRDHSLVNDMVMHGELTEEEAKTYPKKNVLTNALGVWEDAKADVELLKEKTDGFLICSDGLHGYVTQEAITDILFEGDMEPGRRARRLIKAALDAGGLDNVTVVLIDLEGTAC